MNVCVLATRDLRSQNEDAAEMQTVETVGVPAGPSSTLLKQGVNERVDDGFMGFES